MCKILHIDDSPIQQLLVKTIFEKNKYDTFDLKSCSSISEAVDILNNNIFDIIITDLNLPDSSKEETIPTLKRLFPNIPIIAVSCEDDMDIALQTIRDGVEYFINKTWELKQLPFTVLTILEKNKLVVQAKEIITRSIREHSRAMVRNITDGLEKTMSLSKVTSSKLKLLKEQRATYG